MKVNSQKTSVPARICRWMIISDPIFMKVGDEGAGKRKVAIAHFACDEFRPFHFSKELRHCAFLFLCSCQSHPSQLSETPRNDPSR